MRCMARSERRASDSRILIEWHQCLFVGGAMVARHAPWHSRDGSGRDCCCRDWSSDAVWAYRHSSRNAGDLRMLHPLRRVDDRSGHCEGSKRDERCDFAKFSHPSVPRLPDRSGPAGSSGHTIRSLCRSRPTKSTIAACALRGFSAAAWLRGAGPRQRWRGSVRADSHSRGNGS